MKMCKFMFIMNFLFLFSMFMFLLGLYFMVMNLVFMFEWELFELNSSMILMLIYMDWISCFFMGVVLLISSMVFMYSKFYMEGEVNLYRFMYLLFFFVVSMLLLIMSPNLISLMLGWDGLGMISYCLVIYYQNVKSSNSGMLTVLMNRVGDVMILMSIVWMINYGTWNFMLYNMYMVNDYQMQLVCFLVFMGAITKSAQIPYSPWLPAAMAAPTPVSALVHSSTLVTAGVYLLVRFSNLMYGMFFMKFLFILSVLTMFMAGVSANYEFDLKKIIALSTLSQLGLMLMILSIGLDLISFYHLLTHALFKSLLFLSAGILIHLMNNNQDIRMMGNLIYYVPLVVVIFNISNLSLCGMPFMAGFYSKDMMAEVFLMYKFNWLVFFFFFFSIGLTLSYSLRLSWFSVVSFFNMGVCFNLYENVYMMLSMFILSLMSLIGGSVFMWLMFSIMHLIYMDMIFKFMVLFFMMVGMMFGIFMYKLNYLIYGMNLYNFMWGMWFGVNLFTYGVILNFLNKSFYMLKVYDLGWFEELGSHGIYKNIISLSNLNLFIQFNNLKSYLFEMFFLLLILFLIF
uniref:NADH-ubiquinone oxidoreductase chain 5 n=1 Tax=Melanotrichia acclivopennis TaxID=2904888 RepID=A0A9E8RSM5_9NEOP|nr:NADH dehydrogenase subunit 5 [Melanotrichia acclivopennis]UZZ44150.1 NADH dehydrogenase subunit 5 [Melanotrichia acclivopennis]